MSSLSLRPGDSLTAPWAALSIDFISFVSFTNAIQARGLLTLTLGGLTPPEHASLTWTYCQRINVSGVTIVATEFSARRPRSFAFAVELEWEFLDASRFNPAPAVLDRERVA